jgi:chemotaxis protein histidine kinase CheA
VRFFHTLILSFSFIHYTMFFMSTHSREFDVKKVKKEAQRLLNDAVIKKRKEIRLFLKRLLNMRTVSFDVPESVKIQVFGSYNPPNIEQMSEIHDFAIDLFSSIGSTERSRQGAVKTANRGTTKAANEAAKAENAAAKAAAEKAADAKNAAADAENAAAKAEAAKAKAAKATVIEKAAKAAKAAMAAMAAATVAKAAKIESITRSVTIHAANAAKEAAERAEKEIARAAAARTKAAKAAKAVLAEAKREIHGELEKILKESEGLHKGDKDKDVQNYIDTVHTPIEKAFSKSGSPNSSLGTYLEALEEVENIKYTSKGLHPRRSSFAKHLKAKISSLIKQKLNPLRNS